MMNNAVESALKQVDTTKMVKIGRGLLGRATVMIDQIFVERPILLIADQNTAKYARVIHETGDVSETFIFPEENLHAEIRHVETLITFMMEHQDAIPVAVGAGTINDLVKLAAHRCGRPYLVVGTAASMDGYAAFGASIENEGYKQTLDCPAPVAVLVDLDVVCEAPREMSAAGYADLLAKIPAGADWILADFFGLEPIHEDAWDIVQTDLRRRLADPDGIAGNETSVIRSLVEGLVMSGLAMQKAKSSRAASGAEHQFSHLWDNQHHTFCGKTPSHGFKVGIGTLATSSLYEKILKLTPKDFQKSLYSGAKHLPDWTSIEALIHRHFPQKSLAEQVIAQSRAKYVPREESLKRIQKVIESWDELRLRLQTQLMPAHEIRELLRRSGAPFDSEQIGIDRHRLVISHEQARLIRMRYNVLDFALEMGLWKKLIPV